MIQANINDRFARLSQSEKAELFGIYASKGYHDLASIIAHYNSCGGKLYGDGGPKKRETAYARKYREEQEAKARMALEHPTLSNAFRNDISSETGDKYYDVINTRYHQSMDALRRKGFTYEDALRLAPLMVTQNIVEGGWRVARPDDNNFGGLRENGRFLKFDSPEEYYDNYLDLLDRKWGASRGSMNNWRTAQTLDDWSRILNREDLHLWSRERYDDYNREHKDNPVYLYAPEWENSYKSYRQHLAGVEPRVNTYLDMVFEEDPYTKEMYDAPIEPVARPNDKFNLSMDQFQKLLESSKSNRNMNDGERLFKDGGDKKQKRLAKLIARLAEKRTDGLISADDVNTILAHPTDYMKHLYTDDELNEMRKRLYSEYYPQGYFNREGIPAASDIMQGKESKGEAKMYRNTMRGAISQNNIGSERMRDAYFAQWLGIPDENRRYPGMLIPSSYTPSVGSLENYPVLSISGEAFPDKNNQIVDAYWAAKQLSGSEFTPDYLMPEKGKGENYVVNPYTFLLKDNLQNSEKEWENWLDDKTGKWYNAKGPELLANGLAAFTVGSGVDPQRGQYISMFDKWDINPFDKNGTFGGGLMAKISKTARIPQNFDATGGVGNPFYIYDRVYLDDYYDVNSRPQNPDEFYGGYIMPTTITAERKANGGKIHIKPENRGKFTALKKRTGHSASWFKAHGTPAQKKMATFALNARKWKHEDGGPLANYLYDGGPYGVIPLGGDYLTYLQNIPEVSGGMIEPSIVTAALPAKFNGSQAAAARYAEGYQKGAKPVSEAMSRAGQDIFNTAKNVAMFVPGPTGLITWGGQMGADMLNGEWRKVGRDVALATAMGVGLGAAGRGIGYLRNYIDDATNFGEDVFRAMLENTPGRVSTNFTYAAPAARTAMEVAPAVAKAVSPSYEIENLGGGYMLKSLMRGNPLEKQLSKNGTVNVNNVRALVGKGSKVEQAVVDKVLASEEFAGKKSIDYNKFRKAVQDELITYERTPNEKFQDYGLDRIGLHFGNKTDVRNAEDRMNMLRERIRTGRFRNGEKLTEADIADAKSQLEEMESFWKQIPETETYTFSSSRIPQGSDKHYNPNTLGHSRTYTTADEPDVLHVMESQSDWAQEGIALDRSKKIAKAEERYPGGFEARRDKVIGDAKKDVETWKKIIETGVAGDGRKLEAWEIENIRTDLLYNAEMRLRELEASYSYVDPQELYLSNNFAPRQIQENLRHAAEKGQTKMRYPTRETAAKIEGYSSREAYFDAEGNDVTTGKLYTIGEENEKELSKLREAYKKRTLELNEKYNAGRSMDFGVDWNAYFGQYDKEYVDMGKRINKLESIKPYLRPGITKKTVYDYEDILHKYTEFPKQYKKLYKNADVRTITDPKGNTWYEVDVPENYLQQEWTYKSGGPLREFANISDLF